MKEFVYVFLAITTFSINAQFVDDFSDGDFANNPAWSGDNAEFVVVDSRLQSNGPEESATLYLSTQSVAIEDAAWSFLIELGFAPSASNRVKVYLVADSEDLESDLNGYYVEIGQSGNDEIKFYRQDGANNELLFTGSTEFVGNINVRIYVTRDSSGQWSIFSDPSGGTSLNLEGEAFVDNTYTSTSFFGVVCIHTSTRSNLFFFDDFVITGTTESDMTAPVVQSASVTASNEVEIVFSEDLDQTIAEDSDNYVFDQNVSVNDATLISSSTVRLTTSELTNGQDYSVTINNLEDQSGNVIAPNSIANFSYLVLSEPKFREVVINEIFSNQGDDNPISNDYIELYNSSGDKFFDLTNWTIEDNNKSPKSLESFILRPNEFLIVSRDTSQFSKEINRLEIALDNFNNDNDHVLLRFNDGEVVDSVGYGITEDGISIEQVNPMIPFFLKSNYGNSTNPTGGTPGFLNSIFDDTPDNTPPTISEFEVSSGTDLQLFFSEPLDRNLAENLTNYSLIDGTVSVATLTQSQSQVNLTVSGLVANTSNEITVENLQDLFGNVMIAETLTFTYFETEQAIPGDIIINEFLSDPIDNNDDFVELFNRSNKFISLEGWTISDESSTSLPFKDIVLTPNSYLIVYDKDAAIDYSTFGDTLTVPSLTLNNDNDLIEIRDNDGSQIAFLEYGTITEEAVSLELVNPNDPCIFFRSYQFSSDASGYTPGRVNSVFDDTPDTIPPVITSFGFSDALVIHFSEIMDVVSLTERGNYEVNSLTITEIFAEDFPSSVKIQFVEEIVPGELYDLTLNGISDCSGNVLESTSISFGFGRAPLFNELIITEVLFDEDPAIGLPEREYLEIYNASEDVISTASLSLTDATNTTDFPIVNLASGEYYVVTSTSGAPEFDNALGLSGFPSLNNSGELLVLSLGDTLINSVAYDPDWHEDEKAFGGYSLEMVDVTNPCLEGPANWRSSEDISGGTPGRPNSISDILPDNIGPEVLKVTAISSNNVKFDFSEKIDPSSIDVAQFNFQPSLTVESVSMNLQEPNALFVQIEGALAANQAYSVVLSDIFDCSGNEVSIPDLVFALPLKALPDEIKLSEVLFNPRTNGVDFVEVYNDSENYISLKNWQLARITEEGIDDEKIVSTDELVINPNEYLVFTTDANTLFTNYPKGLLAQFVEIPSIPTYPNDTGNVVLLNAVGEVIERFHYDQDYHYNLLESVDGVSLERISFSNPTDNPNNWRSASSTAGFATPGYANSQSSDIELGKATVNITPKVFIPGNVGSGRDYTTINYQFDVPGQFANVNIYDQNGRLVRNLAQGELLATTGFLRWDGETNSGSIARLGYYVVFFEVYDARGNTEIIKKTVAVGRDF